MNARPITRISRAEALGPERDGTAAELLDHFLGNETLAVMERRLPVVSFHGTENFKTLGLDGLRALLDLKAEFGLAVALREVRRGGNWGDRL